VNAPKIFTIAAGTPFAQALAQGLIARAGPDPLALAAMTIYLPTRRAARNFGEVFARIGGGAALLPQFRPLGDAEEDDLPFDAASDAPELAPAIAPVRRQLLLAALIRRWLQAQRAEELTFAQAASLADSLCVVMDEMENQGVDPARLTDLAPAVLARHWEEVADFLGLLKNAWPEILAAEKRMNPAARRSLAIEALARRLADDPPPGPVIAAGSTGSIPATARLLDTIARLPQGAVVLPGLDKILDAESWNALDPGHPQFGLKQLLAQFGVARADVADWGAPLRENRVQVLREALRPAPTTDAWQALRKKGAADISDGLAGLGVLHAADPAQEALAIALALRHSLETPQRSAALVTPDRNLARRVAGELRRWKIEIDDSSGRPLSHMAAGRFLCLLAEAAAARFAPVALLALLQHPFASGGQETAQFRHRARLLDRFCLRGPSPDPGLDGIAAAIGRARDDKRLVEQRPELEALALWWDGVAVLLRPLESCFSHTQIDLGEIVQHHIAVATALATDQSGADALTRGEDGATAARLLADVIEGGMDIPPIEPDSYPTLFRSLAAKCTVRAATGRHPRLAILGPLEARLLHFDFVVLGGLNEGTWPASAAADPWFSRLMRASLGLEQPERAIGLAAHDFSILAAGPEVLLTRSRRSQGAPTIPSRWLQRLMQLTRGLELDAALQPDTNYGALALALTRPRAQTPIAPPMPRPPLSARPRSLSVTEIETWQRDPYAIYARHILRLRPLKALEEETGPLERGSAIHLALEKFVREHPQDLPPDAAARLIAIADSVFAQAGIPKAVLALWRPRFAGAAHWFIDKERERRSRILRSHLEIRGTREFSGPGGSFHLRCRADRIDELVSGGGAVLDYKTGLLPSMKQVREMLAPQLPLEGAILSVGGFDGVAALTPEELTYLRLTGGAEPGEERNIEDAALLSEKAAQELAAHIALFDDAATPYPSRVRPYRSDVAGDYDHLARVREWSLTGWADSE
jgi:ATP-dependent helicase/nuclease subunit B